MNAADRHRGATRNGAAERLSRVQRRVTDRTQSPRRGTLDVLDRTTVELNFHPGQRCVVMTDGRGGPADDCVSVT